MTVRLVLLLLLWVPLPALAQPTAATPATQLADVGEWHLSVALGYGYIENPRVQSDGANTYLLPSVSYYGERFYLENTTLGYSLYEGERVLLDLQSKLNEDAFHFEIDGLKNVLLSEVLGYAPIAATGPLEPKQPRTDVSRRLSYMAGLHALMPTRFGNLSFGAYQDITSVHNGHELQAKFNRTFTFEHWAFAVEAGLTYKSNELLNYYYAVMPSDRDHYQRHYADDNRLSHHLRLITKVPLSERWNAVAVVEYNGLAEAIQRSRLIEERSYLGAFFGFSYDF